MVFTPLGHVPVHEVVISDLKTYLVFTQNQGYIISPEFIFFPLTLYPPPWIRPCLYVSCTCCVWPIKNKDDHRRRCNLFCLGNKWMMKKETLKKNPSNRKPISYSTEFRLDINLNNFVRKLCPAMINAFQDTFGGGELKCYRHTDPQTKRVLEEHSLLKRNT